jgi:hypothetical protein
LVRRKLATSYPLLTIWLIFGAVRSAYLLYVLVYDRRAYGAMTAMFSTWNIAGWVLITIECFISMAKHLKGAYQLAGAVILFGCLGATLCHVTENFAPWPYIYTWMLELYRHAALCCLTVVVLSRWFMTQWRPPKNALRYCDALILFFAGEMLAYWIFRSSLGRYWTKLRRILGHDHRGFAFRRIDRGERCDSQNGSRNCEQSDFFHSVTP